MTVIEEVVVHRSEPLLLPLGQGLRCGSDVRLIHTGMAGILVEQAFAGQLGKINLLGRVGERGVEMTVKTASALGGNLPDAEESEYMVDSESVEVLRHFLQTGLPPGVIVLLHLLPVVSGEAPVLSVLAEGNRLSDRLWIYGGFPGADSGYFI